MLSICRYRSLHTGGWHTEGPFVEENCVNAKKSWRVKDTYGLKNSGNRASDTEGIIKSVLSLQASSFMLGYPTFKSLELGFDFQLHLDYI